MAYVEFKICHICGKKTNYMNGNCSICEDRKTKDKIAKWNAQATVTKLNDLRKRVENLERGPIRF